MIVGQNWEPYIEMQNLIKRNLEKFLSLSAKNNNMELIDNFMDKIYITNAIVCARKGEKYRGNDINLKIITLNCTSYLKKTD